MEETLNQIPQNSFLKRYLIEKRVLNEEGTLTRSPQDVLNAIKLLPALLGLKKEQIEEFSNQSYNLKLWSQEIPKLVYEKFLVAMNEALDKVPANQKTNWMKNLEAIRDSQKNSPETKIEKSRKILAEIKGYPNIQKLKDLVSLTFNKSSVLNSTFMSGPLQELDLGLDLEWDPSCSFSEKLECKRNLELLYLIILFDLANQKNIPLDVYSLYRNYEKGDFSSIDQLAELIPLKDRKSALKDKIQRLYQNFPQELPTSDLSFYQEFLSFKKAFQAFYQAQQFENHQDALLAQEAYESLNLKILFSPSLECKGQEEEDSSLEVSGETVGESLDPPCFTFKDFKSFEKWSQKQSKGSVLKQFIDEFFLNAIQVNQTNEEELLYDLHFARDLMVCFLKKAALSIKENIPEEFESLDHLNTSISEIAYKKFLFSVSIFQKKYKKNLFLKNLEEINNENISLVDKKLRSFKILEEMKSASEIEEKDIQSLKDSLLKFNPKNTFQYGNTLQADCFFNTKKGIAWVEKRSLSGLLFLASALFKETEKGSIPLIYTVLIRDAFKIPDLEILERIQNQVIYHRFFQFLKRVHLVAEGRDLSFIYNVMCIKGKLPIAEKIAKLKEIVGSISDPEFSTYLLFQLEKPYCEMQKFNSEELKKMELCAKNYLGNKENEGKPFYQFLEENHFSVFTWDQETANYFYQFYFKFIKKQALKADTIPTGMFFKEELVKNNFELIKLDRLSEMIESEKSLDLEACIDFDFKNALKRLLSLKPDPNLVLDVLKKSSSLSNQLEFLKELENHGDLFRSVLARSNKKIKKVFFAYLKEKTETDSVQDFICFAMKNYFNYTPEEAARYTVDEKRSQSVLKTLEDFIQEEGPFSAFRLLLEKSNMLEPTGRVKQVFSPMCTLKELQSILESAQSLFKMNTKKNHAFISRTPFTYEGNFNQIDASNARLSDAWYSEFLNRLPEGGDLKQQCKVLYNALDSSWKHVLTETKKLLKTNQENVSPDFLEIVFEELFLRSERNVKELSDKTNALEKSSSFSLYLEKIGFDFFNEVDPCSRYDFFVFCVNKYYNYLLDKHVDLLKKIDGNNFLYGESLYTNELLEENGHEKIQNLSDLSDRFAYLEYQYALSNMPKSKSQAAKKIRNAVSTSKGSPLDMIKHAQNNLKNLDLTPQDQEKLASILERSDVFKSLEMEVESDWKKFKQSRVKYAETYTKNSYSIVEKSMILDKEVLSFSENLIRDLSLLKMNPMYKKLVEIGFYNRNWDIFNWISLEISYKKYEQALQNKPELTTLYELHEKNSDVLIEDKVQSTLNALKANVANPEYEELFNILT